MNKTIKNVLVIEDKLAASRVLVLAFQECAELTFKVQTANNLAEADTLLQKQNFDVITIDLNLGHNVREGLDILQKQMLFGSYPDAIKIVVTGYSDLRNCVQAMRWGAWDFFDKDGAYAEKVVDSAVKRINELEEARLEERQIFDEWLPGHELMLQEQFPDQYVAIQDGTVIAHGNTMIALGANLVGKSYSNLRKPFILQVQKKEMQ